MSEETPAKKPDWAVIEAEYRAGIKPLRLIGEEQGISHAAINKRAKRDEWSRDLGAKIQAKAEALVSKAAVTKEVASAKKVTEQAIVEAAATIQYTVRMEHRADIKRSRVLFRNLLGELEAVGTPDGQHLIDQLIESLNGPEDGETEDAARRRQTRNRKLLSEIQALPTRIDSGKRLVEMLEKLVRMEREAFGISTDEGGDNRGGAKTVIVPAKDIS